MILTLVVAAAPAVIMFIYVYKKDKIEKEPKGLLWKLVIGGAVSVIPAVILELIGGAVLDRIPGLSYSAYVLLEMFLIVALSEELCKFFALKIISWRHPAFDYMFDGMLYAICVAIGFSVLEDIMYMIQSGIGTGLVRALTFIPGHFGFAVFSGLLYSKARECENRGDHAGVRSHMIAAVVFTTILHGFYDSCLSFESGLFILMFLAFVVIMYIAVFFMIKKASKTDHPI